MMTFNQFKSGIAAFLLVLVGMQASAQTFWTQDFGDQTTATTNWVTTGSTNAGTLNWEWTNNLNAGFQDQGGAVGAFTAPTAANGYFLFNSDGNGNFAHDMRLTGLGVPVNCTGKNDVHLRFFTEYARFSAAAILEVGTSTNGTNWTYTQVLGNVGSQAIYENVVDVDLPAADNQAQVWIQFRWRGQDEFHFKVDDLELFDVPPAMPQVTFRVNMATQTVDPGGVFIAGAFNNWTNEALTNTGNGVWSITKTLAGNTAYQYKFKNGANGWESAPGLVTCGINDGSGNINRLYTSGTADETLAAVCFNSCLPCVLTCAQNPNSIICDNFDTYVTTQKLAQQSPTNWGVWSNGAGGGGEDGVIVTTPVSSAPNALKVEATAAAGGPMDLVLKLQNKTTGHYSLKWKMNVPTGKKGYINMQGIVPIPATPIFNYEMYFGQNVPGAGEIIIAAATVETFTFPHNEWFTIEQRIDLDNNLLALLINNVLVGTIAYPGNIGGIDFYGVNNTYQYFIDDLEYVQLAPVVYNVDVCDNAINLNPYIGLPAGQVSNVGPYDITNATVAATDPAAGFECHFNSDVLQGTQWFTFVGDGNRYMITSADCGAAPIADGDNQFALYTGSCGSFVPVACNDDVSNTDLHASLTFQTVAGTTYFLMVDPFNNLPGTYCLNIAQVGNITCAQGTVGTNAVSSNGNVCFGANLSALMSVDAATYVIPNTLPGVSGHLWCISQAPLTAGTWPGTITGIASTAASPAIGLVGLVNDGAGFPAGVYYLTSVVVAGGTLIDPAGIARVFNIDATNGCFFIGTSHQITLWPEFDPITALNTVTNATAPGWNGAVNITAGGGTAAILGLSYTYQWSNGTTNEDLTGVPPGTYTVTIVEASGCGPNFVGMYTVGGFISGTTDPASVSALSLTPNPTSGLAQLRMELAQSAEVRIDIVNALGQVVITRHLGTTNTVAQEIDLSNMADGTYFMRATLDGETAIRTIVVNK